MRDIDRRTFSLGTLGALSGIAGGALPMAARAQADFPNRVIKVVVPFTPGSASDSASRFFGERLGQKLGQTVVVENRAGGGGVIAMQSVRSSPADGYTILLGNISLMTVNPVVMANLPYDPLTDVKPLSGLVVTHGALVVPNESPHKSLADLLKAAAQKPLTFGTFSPAYRLAAANLAHMANVNFTDIPYKGAAPLSSDLLGNHMDAAFFDVSGQLPMLQSGKVRVLGTTGRRRNAGLPQMPTIAELGFPNYAHESWVGFFTHVDTPQPIADKLTATLQGLLQTPEAADFAKRSSVELFPYQPPQLKSFIASEIARFRAVAKQAGIEPS